MKSIDALWGGVLTDLSLDPCGQRLTLSVRVVEGGIESMHTLECRDVQDFRFFNRIKGPWTYSEVTEAYAAFDAATGRWQLEATLWSDDAGITVYCGKIILDGAFL